MRAFGFIAAMSVVLAAAFLAQGQGVDPERIRQMLARFERCASARLARPRSQLILDLRASGIERHTFIDQSVDELLRDALRGHGLRRLRIRAVVRGFGHRGRIAVRPE